MKFSYVLAVTLVCLGLLAKGSHSKPARKHRGNNGGRKSYDPYGKFQPMVARACNFESLDVYKEIAPRHDNIVFSPFSLCSLLAVCTYGAKGSTRQELKGKLNLKLTNHKELSKIYTSVYKSFMEEEDVNINTSNVMLLNKNLQLVQEAEDDYRNSFNGSVRTFDPDMKKLARTAINSLVSSATEGLVEGELKADDVVERALYFFNTLELSARWQDEFKIEDTAKLQFYVNASSSVPTDTMTRRGQYRTTMNNDLGCKIIEMPYKGGRFAMYILLPFEKDGLKEMEKKMTDKHGLKMENLFTEIGMGPTKTIDLYLPKFTISQSFSLKEALKANKITTLFNDRKADLSGLVQEGKVFIKEVLQGTSFALTEGGTLEGTVADKEGAPVGQPSSLTTTFKADHPFLYILRDKQTDFNIVMGKFSKP